MPEKTRYNGNGDTSPFLGFANLPNQVHRKSVKKGFEFTLLIIGESGLGKSTLVNSLFQTNLFKDRKIPSLEESMKNNNVEMVSNTVEIEERGVKLKLTVVSAPGFGDSINNEHCFEPIKNYIDDQFSRYLEHECGLNRRHILDTRIHCCFYFISPIGYGLKALDIQTMKMLHTRVNLIPIIGKADALTKTELLTMKKRILQEIRENGITIYTVPDCETDEEESFREQIEQIKAAIPFAITSNFDDNTENGNHIKAAVNGRSYPWGTIEIDNSEHCDFIKLKSLLITNMQDLKEVTESEHYENFRSMRLAMSGGNRMNSSSIISDAPDSLSLEETERILQAKNEELRKAQEQIQQLQQKMMAKIPQETAES